MSTRLPRRYLAVLVVAVLAVLVGAAGPLVFGAFANPSAKDLIAADPPPRLFPDSDGRAAGEAGRPPRSRRRTR